MIYPISSKALLMIESALGPMIRSGKQLGSIKIVVCARSQIASSDFIETKFGFLQVFVSTHVPKGFSYLIESPLTKGGIGFKWVSKM